MTNFISLSDTFQVAPQISFADIEKAKLEGITLLISNRPDNEEPGQLNADTISEASSKEGIEFLHIPVGPTGISQKHLDEFDEATAKTTGKVLAFCRSGTRSTIVRAFALARSGGDIDQIISEAGDAGYDIRGQRQAMEMLSRE